MKFSAELYALGLAMLAAPGADAFWRMECRGRSGLARIDPLVNPGAKSSHAHTIAGGSGKSITIRIYYLLADSRVKPRGLAVGWLTSSGVTRAQPATHARRARGKNKKTTTRKASKRNC